MKKGIYAGSFDPITNGHLNIIKRSLNIFDDVVIGIGCNPLKKCLFSIDERIDMIKRSVGTDIEVYTYDGLLIDFAKKLNINILIRGLRSYSDLESEIQLHNINKTLYKDIETCFLLTDNKFSYISSTVVKSVAIEHGDVSSMIPCEILEDVLLKFNP